MTQTPSTTLQLAHQLTVNDPERLALLLAEARRQALWGGGDFIELGVFRGGTALLLAQALLEQASPQQLHLLDSWQGMPPPDAQDQGALVGEGYFANASEAKVRESLASRGLLAVCKTYAGWFEDTLPAIAGPFALAHVDCDYYAPVRMALHHLLPRMTPFGSIVIDDYGSGAQRSFPGVERAVAEAIAGTEWRVLPLGGARDQSVILMRAPPHAFQDVITAL